MLIRPIAGLVLCLLASGAAAQGSAPPLDAAVVGGAEGAAAVRSYLEAGDPSPKATAERARELIRALPGQESADPMALKAAAERIAAVAGDLIQALKVVQAIRHDDLKLPERAFALKFGPANSELPPGFALARASDPRLKGETREVAGVGVNVLLNSGVSGVKSLEFPLADGDWRVILLTADPDGPTRPRKPFGDAVVVNGVRHAVARSEPHLWIQRAALTRAGAGRALGEAVDDRGGLIVLQTAVREGRLRIAFEGVAFLAALIVEPAAGDTVLAMTRNAADAAFASADESMESIASVESAVGEALAAIATAAGPTETAALLGIERASSEPDATISPN